MTDPDAPKCAKCKRPMRHDTALICSPCETQLRNRLDLVARIAGDVTLTVAKITKVTRHGAGEVEQEWYRGSNALEPTPLPPDLDRAQRHDAAVAELSTWARVVAEERGKPARPWAGHVDRPPQRMHPLAELAGVLSDNLTWLRHHPAADEAWPALLTATYEIERVVDTQVAGQIVGLCACGSALYGARCRRCGDDTQQTYSRADLDAAMRAYPVTASEAAVWVADMGLVADTSKLRKLIWAWADRGHIAAVDDIPRYRFGDVLARVMASPALRVA